MAILGLSGCKQGGKSTAANFLLGLVMQGIALVDGEFVIGDDGKLWISDILKDTRFAGIFDYYRRNVDIDDLKKNYIDRFIKLYSYADKLKQDVCMSALGLTYEQCYGTDADKNSETRYRWEDMPGIITPEQLKSMANMYTEPKDYNDTQKLVTAQGLIVHISGPMTARDVMQYIGTEIFRRMYGDVWVASTLLQIKEDNSAFAVITDVRFPNEVQGIQEAGGKVMRLTRNPFKGEDVHESETALDKDKFDWNKFDWIIDNEKPVTVLQQNHLVQQALIDSGWLTNI